MDNEILTYTASYITARMAILLVFGYAIYRVLRPARARARRFRRTLVGNPPHELRAR
jgi:hypothetical protein